MLTGPVCRVRGDPLRPPSGSTPGPNRYARSGTTVRQHRDFPCDDAYCPIRTAVVSPLVVEERVVGTLQVFATGAPAGLVRATSEVAAWVSGHLELAELADSRARLVEA